MGGVKAIGIINKYLRFAPESSISKLFPVSESQIRSDRQLRERLIVFLGDVYTYMGMDENYEDNHCGMEVQDAITFLAFCNGCE